jgi:hypothetical protein
MCANHYYSLRRKSLTSSGLLVLIVTGVVRALRANFRSADDASNIFKKILDGAVRVSTLASVPCSRLCRRCACLLPASAAAAPARTKKLNFVALVGSSPHIRFLATEFLRPSIAWLF